MRFLSTITIFFCLTLSSLYAQETDYTPREVSWEAEWIGGEAPQDDLSRFPVLPARYFRKEFELRSGIVSAELHISGLGLYKAWLNGRELGAGNELAPTVSHYEKTVYFNSFEVAKLLSPGPNAISVSLGNGRYAAPRIDKQTWFYGLPCLICQLELTYADGSRELVCSDTSWKLSTDGPICANNEYDGEVFDARKDLGRWTFAQYDDSSWRQAEAVEGPRGTLTPQLNPDIAVQDILRPKSIKKMGDKYILDMGVNMVGRLQFKARGLKEGDTLKLRFAERLDSAGALYTENLRTAKVEDIYVAGKARRVTWHPDFTYHGFRYVELSGWKRRPCKRDFEGQVMYDRMATTGRFETSNKVLNRVYSNCFWGIRGNYRGMPTDCPQRDERQGWLGDRTMNCYGEGYLFNNRLLYTKWLRDIEDSQTPEGELPVVAPPFWKMYNRDNMTWPGAFITIADMLYRQYGDVQPILDHYPAMAKWMDYMWEKYSDEGLLRKDVYGDWCVPPESLELIHSKDPARKTSKTLIGTSFYYYLAGIMEKFAALSGHPEDIARFEERRDSAKLAYNDRYFNADEGFYSNNTVTANALSLHFGLVPEAEVPRVFANLVERSGDHVNCGLVGIMVLMRVLSDYGRPDLAFTIASNDTYPSWGYMATQGATTIWELWNGNTAAPDMNSMNHVMMIGDLLIWEYEYLGGIRPAEPGFAKVELKPYPVPGLDWVKCSYDSEHGRIVSNWKRRGKKVIWKVEVPVPATALIPSADGSGREVRELAPGKYRFKF